VTLPQARPICSSITSTTAYNQYREPTQTTHELGNVRTFNYDVNFSPQSVTDGVGTLSTFIFNNDGTIQAGAIGYDISANPSKASQFTYDSNGNMASHTDALGRTTSYTYDSLGHKITMIQPLPNSNTNLAAATTTYTYDTLGNLIQTAAPLGRTTSSTYDANGNKITDTDPLGHITTYQYDALNRLTTTTYPTQPSTTTTRTYDFRNKVVDETDQAGHITPDDTNCRNSSCDREAGGFHDGWQRRRRQDGRYGGSRSLSEIADPVGGLWLPLGPAWLAWAVWRCALGKNFQLRGYWEAETVHWRVLQAFFGFHAKRKSFSKLLVAQTSFHSARTLSRPRKLKRRKPRTSLICPKTGSTIAFLIM
jgi:YD repeat-containing protein